jgi:hypothetical protein
VQIRYPHVSKRQDSISPSLAPIHSRLVEIHVELQNLLNLPNLPASFSLAEVQLLQDDLREIESLKVDGKFETRDGIVVAGQASVFELVELCYEACVSITNTEKLVEELNCRAEEDVDGKGLSHIYESLNINLRKLKRLELMSHWFSAAGGAQKLEKELLPIQQELGRIDDLRVDGKFMDEGRVPPGQAVLHFLLHKCYRITNKLQAKAEVFCFSYILGRWGAGWTRARTDIQQPRDAAWMSSAAWQIQDQFDAWGISSLSDETLCD